MIGVLGGTFDPIHFGHVKPALELLNKLPLTEIRLVPVHQSPHRSPPVATPRQRWQMLNIVVAQQPGLVADDRELKRGGISYTMDTLEELRTELGPEKIYCLILGGDAFLHFTRWHRWRDILGVAHLVVMHRPGYDSPVEGEVAALLQKASVDSVEQLSASRSGKVYLCETTPVAISATDIRECIRAGKQPRFMLSGPLWAYIKNEGLYGYR